jgi:putative hydrolase of the HAD superfamily
MPAAVVFDLDFTLAVTARRREAILADAIDAVDAPDLAREEYLREHNRSHEHETREPIFASLLDDRGDDTDPAALAAAYRQHIADALEPVPDAADLVRRLRRDYRVGLLTNGPVVAQRDKLDALGWTDLFDAVVVSGDLDAGKPDPGAFRAVCRELGVDPADAVYVGDDVEADVRGAADAGLRVVQVVSDGGPDPDPRADAHVRRDRLADDLPGIVADLA